MALFVPDCRFPGIGGEDPGSARHLFEHHTRNKAHRACRGHARWSALFAPHNRSASCRALADNGFEGFNPRHRSRRWKCEYAPWRDQGYFMRGEIQHGFLQKKIAPKDRARNGLLCNLAGSHIAKSPLSRALVRAINPL
jgi:hypothetical protein